MKRKTYDVITLGGATRDIAFYTNAGRIIETPRDLTCQKLLGFEYGAKIISEKVFFSLGGGGCNTAVSFARLGLKTASWIVVGQDREGDSIIKDLKAERVATEFVHRDPKLSTGLSFITITERTKDHVAFLYRGANNNLLFPHNVGKLLNAQWLYVSSLTGKNWKRTADAIIDLVNKKKVRLAWNPGETQLLAGQKKLLRVLKATEVLLINQDEAIELVLSAGFKPKRINDPKTLIKIIKEWGPKIVVITQGKKGAFAYNGQRNFYSPVISAPVVDTTGAGDCFGSSFVAGLVKCKGDVRKAIKLGMINTASLVQKIGAQGGLLKWSAAKNKF